MIGKYPTFSQIADGIRQKSVTGEAETTKSVVSSQIFIGRALSQKRKLGRGKSIHFMNALFKTNSNINVW